VKPVHKVQRPSCLPGNPPAPRVTPAARRKPGCHPPPPPPRQSLDRVLKSYFDSCFSILISFLRRKAVDERCNHSDHTNTCTRRETLLIWLPTRVFNVFTDIRTLQTDVRNVRREIPPRIVRCIAFRPRSGRRTSEPCGIPIIRSIMRIIMRHSLISFQTEKERARFSKQDRDHAWIL